LAIERTDADLMHLERRITALEGRSRNILLRLHDKIVGYCTVFGTVVGIGPANRGLFRPGRLEVLRSGAPDRAGPGRADRRLPRDHLDTAGQPQGVTCSGFSPA
jgi:hypothetical protein